MTELEAGRERLRDRGRVDREREAERQGEWTEVEAGREAERKR